MSFRQFGGKQFAAKNNIVSTLYNTSNSLFITQNVGQPNSYINFESDISGNIVIYGNLVVTENETVLGLLNANGGIVTPSGSFQVVSSNSIDVYLLNTISDHRVKENVQELDDSYTVDNLVPVTYKNKQTQKQDIGLIAHEVQKVYPILINGEKNGEKLQSINYNGFIPILIKEIQELKRENKLINEKLSSLLLEMGNK